ncbi:targeting protein for Xklp2 isoform X1 [Anastrepha obliqua]|uniref:targeting protein for Xklp2 isoform X1 n=1 Tax=Anastrepha obliqua TaxID=95512 RepID=UPI00240994B5|nr:targeting protein for Xklp2 isoform X1 [Anastrepha obliqua]XP_054730998.1 targeting protein for Xklp2 isoform X1 [Anastrepha obliqua]
MEYIDVNMLPMKNDFNWDDIEVGNHVLDHSQNFFGKKHIKCERLNESEENMDLLKKIDAITFDEINLDKENFNIISTPKTAIKSPLRELQALVLNESNNPQALKIEIQPQINPGCVEKGESTEEKAIVVKNQSPAKYSPNDGPTRNPVNLSESLIARNRARINPGGNKNKSPAENLANDAPPIASNPVILSESLIVRNKARINPGIKKEKSDTSSTPVPSSTKTGTVAKQAPAPVAPHAYQCNELYKRRKEELIRKRLDDERKKREFHSRPAPNFSACHKSLKPKKVVHAVTVPVTPAVLKKSRECDAKRKQKLEELKQLHPPKFEPRPTTILYEEPFVPKKTQTILVSCPFNLHSERRLQERKQYDAAMQRAMEEKLKQVEIEEEERQKREELRVKELRKLTTFKARPNPFK